MMNVRLLVWPLIFWAGQTFGAEFKTLEIGHRPGPAGASEINILASEVGLTSFRADQPALYHSVGLPVPLTESSDFQTFTPIVSIVGYTGPNFELQIRSSTDGQNWDAWVSVPSASQAPVKDSLFLGEMLVWNSNIQFFEYQFIFPAGNTGSLPPIVRGIRLDFFSPGAIAPLEPEDVLRVGLPGADPDCPCTLPAFADRSQWDCPDGRAPSCATPAFAPTSHLVLHEISIPSVITNFRALVRSVWQVQTQTYGRCDLTFNWLIDPNGVIYEGRGGGDDVQGEHLCANNTGTMGIGMIGNFTETSPSPAAMAALAELMTWKSCDSGLDPRDLAAIHQSSNQLVPVINIPGQLCGAQESGPLLSSALPFLRQHVGNKLDTCLLGVAISPEILYNIQLGPNPTHNQVLLTGDALALGPHNWKLINIHGQLVQEGVLPARTRHSLNLAQLGSGVYMLQLNSSGGKGFWQKALYIISP